MINQKSSWIIIIYFTASQGMEKASVSPRKESLKLSAGFTS
jgi:hypothetical protein